MDDGDEFEFITLKAGADYNKPYARMTNGATWFVLIAASPVYVVFASFGKGDCALLAYFSVIFGVLIALDNWFLHKTIRFWLVMACFCVVHTALVVAAWHIHLQLGRWSLYPVGALDLILCTKWVRKEKPTKLAVDEASLLDREK